MEKRARDLKAGDRYREIGDLDDAFHEVSDNVSLGSDGCRVFHEPTPTGTQNHRFRDADEVVEVADPYLVSFGGVYKTSPHPVLGFWPELGEDAVLMVYAADYAEARQVTYDLIGSAWCAIYGPTDPPGWIPLNLGLLTEAVANPHPTSWTVGASVTVNGDGTLELNIEDLVGDLVDEGAPQSVWSAVSDVLAYQRPTVGWLPKD